MVVLKCYQRRLLNLFSQFLENADKIPKSKAMGYLPKKGKKSPVIEVNKIHAFDYIDTIIQFTHTDTYTNAML